MNDSFNPYQFDAEPENVSRTGDFDLEDYEDDGKSCPPWPKTPFTVELYRRKRFRKEYYRLTVNQTDFLLESEHLDAPIRGSRSSAKKCFIETNTTLIVEFPNRKKLLLKPVKGENLGVKCLLFRCWAQQIEKEEDCQKRIRGMTPVFFADSFFGLIALFLFVNLPCTLLTWLGFFEAPILVKTIWTACLAGIIFLTWKSTKKIWPLYFLLAFFIVLAILIALLWQWDGFSKSNEFSIFTLEFILFLYIRSGIYGIIRLRRAIKDPLYRENIGEM